MKPLERPKLEFEKIETILPDGTKGFIAGKHRWLPIIIESDTKPSGDCKWSTDTNDGKTEHWELEGIKSAESLGDNRWRCEYDHARQKHVKS